MTWTCSLPPSQIELVSKLVVHSSKTCRPHFLKLISVQCVILPCTATPPPPPPINSRACTAFRHHIVGPNFICVTRMWWCPIFRKKRYVTLEWMVHRHWHRKDFLEGTTQYTHVLHSVECTRLNCSMVFITVFDRWQHFSPIHCCWL